MENLLQTIKNNFRSDAYSNEEAVRSQICYPLLQELGWNTFDPQYLKPEFQLSGRRVDIALCGYPNRPCVFIEVKRMGNCSADGEEQLFDYANNNQVSIPMVILTDGNEWHFFNSFGSGSSEQKKVYTLNISTDSIQDCINAFQRYLKFDDIKNETAFDNLRIDHRQKRLDNEATQSINNAWQELVASDDELLITMLTEKVQELVGHSPKRTDIISFLQKLKPIELSQNNKPTAPRQTSVNINNITTATIDSSDKGKKYKTTAYWYKIGAESYDEKQAWKVFVTILDEVIYKYACFDDLKQQDFNKSRKGYYISENKEDVHVPEGYKIFLPKSNKWVSIQSSSGDKRTFLRKVGLFYEQRLGKKILDARGSGVEFEFDIPTRERIS